MEQKIKEYLREIEEQREIEILLACETGSRAWGFPSPDSDYDVRFIYKHKEDWYLQLFEQKDTIEIMYDNNEIDLSGWDIRKTLLLLWKSNPPLLERIQSSIIYSSKPGFIDGMHELSKNMYSKIATMHHYLSMAKSMYEKVKESSNEVKLKTLFYAIRTSFVCRWIIEKEMMPPIWFPTVLENIEIDGKIKDRIYELIALKSTLAEDYCHQQEIEINRIIEKFIEQAEACSAELSSPKREIQRLNTFFLHTLRGV